MLKFGIICGLFFCSISYSSQRTGYSNLIRRFVSDLNDMGIELVSYSYEKEKIINSEKKLSTNSCELPKDACDFWKNVENSRKSQDLLKDSCSVKPKQESQKKDALIHSDLIEKLLRDTSSTSEKISIFETLREVDSDNYSKIFTPEFIQHLENTPHENRSDILYFRFLSSLD